MVSFSKYLIIGGGVAGTTAAETIRERDSAGTVTIVSGEPYRLYSRVMLSKANFFLEKIPFERVWLKTEEWYREKHIDLLCGRKAVALDAALKTVRLDDGSEIKYEKLLLAVGASARPWTVLGAEKSGIFYVRSLDHAKAVIAAVKAAKRARPGRARAVAVGAGFISFEMCAMLRAAGLGVALAIREPHYWDPLLDEASGRVIEDALEQGGVEIFRNAEVAEVRGGDAVQELLLKDGTKLPAGLVIAGIGAYCPHDWIAEAGVPANSGILTNEFLETKVPDIWAAGDAAEFEDPMLGERIQLGNWMNAQAHGKVAGTNMAGGQEPFRAVSFYATQGFGLSIAFAGDARPGPGREFIIRDSEADRSRLRLVMKEQRIVGAALINRARDLGAVLRLISRNADRAAVEKFLADAFGAPALGIPPRTAAEAA